MKHLTAWLNRRDVRDALNIDVNYTRNWVAFGGSSYLFRGNSMAAEVKQMVDGGLRVILYNGDLDSECNFIGARE